MFTHRDIHALSAHMGALRAHENDSIFCLMRRSRICMIMVILNRILDTMGTLSL